MSAQHRDSRRFREQDLRRQADDLRTLASDDVTRRNAARLGIDVEAMADAADAAIGERLGALDTERTSLPVPRGYVRRKRGVVRPGDANATQQRALTVHAYEGLAVHGTVPSYEQARAAAIAARREYNEQHREATRNARRPLTKAERRAKRKRR